jgi:hypothetical protein
MAKGMQLGSKEEHIVVRSGADRYDSAGNGGL